VPAVKPHPFPWPVKTGKNDFKMLHGTIKADKSVGKLRWIKPGEAEASKVFRNFIKMKLDGRDPNGYAGIAWSVGGLHDRPWFKRPVFGSVRYMGGKGIRAKFNIERYIEQNSD
jgi:deoxyribodipyrimidine photo-lyase